MEMGRSEGAVYDDMDTEWKDRGESGGGVGGKRWAGVVEKGISTAVEVGGR